MEGASSLFPGGNVSIVCLQLQLPVPSKQAPDDPSAGAGKLTIWRASFCACA